MLFAQKSTSGDEKCIKEVQIRPTCYALVVFRTYQQAKAVETGALLELKGAMNRAGV